MARETAVIMDPVKHAGEKYHTDYFVAESCFPWHRYASFCTTEQFSSLAGGFVRHCGPTAMTNLILTLRSGEGILCPPHREKETDVSVPPEVFSTENVFLKTAAIGKKLLAYWNIDFLHFYGGTSNVLAEYYLAACLRAFGFSCRTMNYFGNRKLTADQILHVVRRVPANPATMQKELKQGRILYLILHHHRCYGDHHLLCYGYQVLENAAGTRRILYFLCADGWSSTPRFLAASELGFCSYCSVF